MKFAARWTPWLLVSGLALAAGCTPTPADNPGQTANAGQPQRVAFVTNQIASFWNIAKVGCEDAAKEFGLEVDVRMPAVATAEQQKRIVEDLLSSGIDGLAISPIDSDNQIDLLNQWADAIPLITHDSDAPGTRRLMYIGMDNYLAGRMCGELVRQAMPEGGKVILTIGRLEQDNAKRRRQGVIDVLIGRESFQSFDPTGDVIEGGGFTILDTLTDQGESSTAKRKAEDALTTYPDLDAIVGLFAYNPPAAIEALKSQNRLGQVKVIGFDEDDATLQGIKDGHVVGTVVQNPYEYGYESVRILKSLLDGDDSVIPESKFIDIPARQITAENVDAFWDDLKAKTGG